MKERALELAKKLEWYSNYPEFVEAGEMICRLVERMVELESCLDFALQDTMDYITLSNLGAENNHWLVWARKLLVNTAPQTKPLSDEEIGIPSGLSDPKSYYQGYEDGIQSLTVTDPRPVAFMKDFGGFTDDPVLAIQDGFNIPVYVTKADYQKIKQKKPCDAPQTKPLSDEEIWEWFEKNTVLAKESALMIARAIEERHGIK